MFFRRQPSVADIAAKGDHAMGEARPRSPMVTALLWIVAIGGPAFALHSMGDTLAGGAWAVVLSLAWLGSYVGLLRTVIWMVMTPICSAAAAFGAPFLAPKLNFLPPNFEPMRPMIAMAIVGLGTLVAIILFINRPAYQFVANRPSIATWNARLGGLLTGTKALGLVVMLIALVLYAEKNRGQNSTLASLAAGAGVDLDRSVVNLASAVRDSHVGMAVENFVPTEKLIDSINLKSLQRMIPGDIAATLGGGGSGAAGFSSGLGGSGLGGSPFGGGSMPPNLRGSLPASLGNGGGGFDVNQLQQLLQGSSSKISDRW